MDPLELVQVASPTIRDLGWAFYFVPETLARGRELGLDGFRFYFLGRGGSLGDVEPNVVASAFGYFRPSLVHEMWTSGSRIVSPRVAGRAYLECCGDFGRRHLADVDGLDAFCVAAGAVNDAADPVGLTLYAAVSAEPLADDPPARAMQLLTVLRELRGSTHLLAIRASGLDALTAHAIKRPEDLSMFGWHDTDLPAITDADRAAHVAAEQLTDRLVLAAYSVLDEAGRTAFITGLEGISAALAAPV